MSNEKNSQKTVTDQQNRICIIYHHISGYNPKGSISNSVLILRHRQQVQTL